MNIKKRSCLKPEEWMKTYRFLHLSQQLSQDCWTAARERERVQTDLIASLFSSSVSVVITEKHTTAHPRQHSLTQLLQHRGNTLFYQHTYSLKSDVFLHRLEKGSVWRPDVRFSAVIFIHTPAERVQHFEVELCVCVCVHLIN